MSGASYKLWNGLKSRADMKTNTPELLKFKRLQRALGESRRGIAGLLELLWLETARQCPDGAIGRFTNEEIAILCDWEGDPDQLVQALLDGPWIDACDVHRLVVHDWEEHCPKYVKGNLASQQKQFAKPNKEISGGLNKPSDALIVQPYSEPLKGTPKADSESEQADPSEPLTTKPSLTKPNQANSSQISEADASGSITVDVFFTKFQAMAKNKGLPVPERLTKKRRDAIRRRISDPEWFTTFKRSTLKLPLAGEGWQPDVDWFIANEDNVNKLAEGKYDWRKTANGNGKHEPQPPAYPDLAELD